MRAGLPEPSAGADSGSSEVLPWKPRSYPSAPSQGSLKARCQLPPSPVQAGPQAPVSERGLPSVPDDRLARLPGRAALQPHACSEDGGCSWPRKPAPPSCSLAPPPPRLASLLSWWELSWPTLLCYHQSAQQGRVRGPRGQEGLGKTRQCAGLSPRRGVSAAGCGVRARLPPAQEEEEEGPHRR